MKKYLLPLLIIIGAIALIWFAPNHGTKTAGAATLPIAGMTYNLSGAGVSGSGTSITLSSFTIKQTGQKIYDSDLSDTFYFTIEPGNNTKQEIVSCTTVVQNAGGSATLSGCSRGLSPISPFTASSTLRFSHGGGSQVIFSDPPQLFNEFYALQNVGTSTNYLIVSSTTPPHYDWNPNWNSQPTTTLVTLGYVSGVSIAGASNSTLTVNGIGQLATGAQAASSTITGSTGANLLISTAISTSSPYTTGSWNVMTQPNAKIKQIFLDLTEAFTFTGALTVNTATTSLNGNAAFAASPTAPVAFRSVYYTFPPAQGATSTVLVNNGSGLLSNAILSRQLYSTTGTITSTSNIASTTIFSFTVPANVLQIGNSIHVRSYVSNATAANGSKQWLDVGYGTASSTVQIANSSGGTIGVSSIIDVVLTGAGTTGTQKLTVGEHGTGINSFTTSSLGALNTASLSQDSTAAKTLILVFRTDTSSSADKITVDQSVANLEAQ